MDDTTFDGLATALARADTRRAALTALLAGAGTALGLAGQRASAQGCQPNGTRCRDGSECCSGRCKRSHGNDGKKRCRRADNQDVCTIEQDFCSASSFGCGEDRICECVVTTKGHSFCSRDAVILTCGCTSDQECEDQVGTGAKCVQLGPNCPFCDAGKASFCATPCPNLDNPT